MKLIRLIVVSMLVVGFCGGAFGIQGLPLTIDNRLRIEYDDNIRQETTDEDSSMKIVEQLQLIGDINAENTFASLRYQPSFIYWADRPESDDNLDHALDLLINQRFSPRLSLAISDTLRYSELSELRAEDDSELIIRPDNTYFYNKVDGAITYRLTSNLKLRANGAYDFVDYDENDVAQRDDYDKYTAGADLESAISKKTSVGGQLRYSDISYDNDPPPIVEDGQTVDRGFGDRGSELVQVGGILQHIFSPNLIANMRAGYSMRDYNAAATDSAEAPYVSASATMLPSPKTRMTLGGTYSLYDADIYPYVGQTRSSVYGSIGHDVTAKVDFFVSATYIQGEYEADEVVDTIVIERTGDNLGGDDDSAQVSSRLRYNFYRNNYLELGYQYTEVSSEVRRDYDRNRYWIGWQTRL